MTFIVFQWILVMVLGLAAGAIVSHDSGVECSVDELEDCLVKLRGSHDRLGKEVIPTFSDSQLEDLCRFLEEAQPCMTLVEEMCTVNNTDPVKVLKVSQRVQEINNGHDFICRDDMKKEYQRVVRECAENKVDELDTAGEICHDNYHNATWFLNKENSDNVHIFCKEAKKYMSCVMDSVLPICGQEVATWAKHFHESLWEAHLKHISCDPEGGMESGAIVIVTLCASSVVYCLVCVLSGFLQENKVCKKIGKPHKKDRQR
ncbi:hypothetical protein LSH36_766g03108 [Paralvinella palmiformis]|uniref:Uncharacterized protein n=1 Tax=Paralvinella palmiformis TaxID=53620 RepID=A0AAD9J1H1_9ANNE|nr:hypothetical protein LSH36_766g03108 [Paralvinella palmiformis]